MMLPKDMLTLKIRPSRRLLFALATMHGLAIWAVVSSGISIAWKLPLILIVVSSMLIHLPRLQGGVRALTLRADGKIDVRTGKGEWQEAVLLPAGFVAPALSVLALRIKGEKRSRYLVLLPDSTEADDYRRLRVRLRWAAARRTEDED
jgi:toxin CptA